MNEDSRILRGAPEPDDLTEGFSSLGAYVLSKIRAHGDTLILVNIIFELFNFIYINCIL